MPTLEENKREWDSHYDWSQRGDEWSRVWGGAEMQWYWSLLPRIHTFLPTGTILEIAPGFGRWTQYLKDLCTCLVVVDLSDKCIQACQERFADCAHIQYFVNDGLSLEMIPDESLDFVCSFDSLVHADTQVLRAYLEQLAKKLKPNGVGFIHHSNLGEYAAELARAERLPIRKDWRVKLGLDERKVHWRDPGMTAARFNQLAQSAGLQCLSQELINWGARRLIDCYSTFTRLGSRWARPNRVMRNPDFMREVRRVGRLSELYGSRRLAPQ